MYTPKFIAIYDMPTRPDGVGRPRIDGVALVALMCRLVFVYDCADIWVERVGGLPKQSASHSFTFGMGAGILHGACIAATGRAPRLVEPQAWKGHARLIGKPKEAAIEAAKIARPDASNLLCVKRGSLTQAQAIGRADALLIGKYVAEVARHAQPTKPRAKPRRRVARVKISVHAGG